jgi:aminoglycoside phosphotransferase (APT) family kinase protein
MGNGGIPAGPDDVTAQWLTGVLGRPDGPVAIDAVQVSPVGTGQTGATYRIAVQYAAPADLPDSFVIKLPAQDPAVRQRVALSYRSEHAFYTRVADTVAVPLPRCYHCTYTDSGDFALLLADMAPAQQGDQIRGCTAAEAHLAVTALAGLHGPRWCDPTWLSFDGTVMPKPDEATARGLGDITRLAATTTIDKVGDRLDPADRATVLEAADVIADWLLGAGERFSILHGDYRADNLLFQAGEVTVVDWQTLAVGLPARDLAYFIGTSLQPAERTGHERALVQAYRQALCGYGVTDYDDETCWQDYRFGMLQIPLITTLGFAFSAATERGDDMVVTMLERGSRAIRDLGTLELVRAGR